MMFFFVQFQRSVPNAFRSRKSGRRKLFKAIRMHYASQHGSRRGGAGYIYVRGATGTTSSLRRCNLTVEKVMTLQLMLKSLSDSKVDLPVSFAGAVIASVPLYVIYIIFQRYFIEGMAISAVKG